MRKKQEANVQTSGLCCQDHLVPAPEQAVMHAEQQQQQGAAEGGGQEWVGVEQVQDTCEIAASLWHEKDQDGVPEHLVHMALKEENKILRKHNQELAKQLLDVQTKLCCVRTQLEYMHYVAHQSSVRMFQHAEHCRINFLQMSP